MKKQAEAFSYKKRRNILLLFASIILLAAAVTISMNTAHAGNRGGGARFGGTIIVADEDYEVICEELGEEIAILDRLYEIFDPSGPSGTSEPSLTYKLMNDANSPIMITRTVMSIIGVALVLIYTGMQFYRIGLREDESLETLMRILISAVVGIFAVIYVYDVMNMLEDLGNTLWREIHKEAYRAADTQFTYTRLAEEVDLETGLSLGEILRNAGNYIKNFFEGLKMRLFTGLASSIGQLALTFTFLSVITGAYGLMFELVIRKVFAPVAMADITINGLRSGSIKFLRGYFAMYVRIAAFIIIVSLGTFVQRWSESLANAELALEVNTALGSFGVAICSRMAMKALITSSGTMINETIGGQRTE